jgi:hypothetical protein
MGLNYENLDAEMRSLMAEEIQRDIDDLHKSVAYGSRRC